ncbi:MAG TPA: hypothetical protein V6C57_24460 [Coleofasciculaceae cyanobacterium]
MNQEARWLAEIKALQQKVAEAAQERDQAYASAANWRKLYETEAKQRRLEANLARQALDALKAELQELQQPLQINLADRSTAVQAEIAQVANVEELQARLMQALLEGDRLSQCLRDEQAAHADTRRSLTTALGDAIDQLNQERHDHSATDGNLGGKSAVPPAPAAENVAARPELKIPSFEQLQSD